MKICKVCTDGHFYEGNLCYWCAKHGMTTRVRVIKTRNLMPEFLVFTVLSGVALFGVYLLLMVALESFFA